MVYECIGFSTEEHGEAGVRYREYTTSEIKAEAWKRLPRIEFMDSGHGIVFTSGPKPRGPKKSVMSLPWRRPSLSPDGPTTQMLMDLEKEVRRERREARRALINDQEDLRLRRIKEDGKWMPERGRSYPK